MQTNQSLRHQFETLDRKIREQLDILRTSQKPELLETDLLKDTLKELYVVVDQLYRSPLVQETVIPVPAVAAVVDEIKETLTQAPVQEKAEPEIPVLSTAEIIEVEIPPVQVPGNIEIPVAETLYQPKDIRQDLQEARKTVYSESISKAAQNGEHLTIGSRYKPEETLSERITSAGVPRRLSDELQRKPLEDLRVSIGLNERFAIINDLFGGNQQGFYAAIDKLNSASSFEVAQNELDSLQQSNGWTSHHPRVIEFTELVRRRFGI